MQPCQLQPGLARARDLEHFQERRDTCTIHVWNLRQIDNEIWQLLLAKDRENLIPQGWSGVDGQTAIQRYPHACLIAGDVGSQ